MWRNVTFCFQLRRDRFIEELESYTKQVEEFSSYGEMSEIQKYLRKAQALDNKLQAAAEKVSMKRPLSVAQLYIYKGCRKSLAHVVVCGMSH